MRPDACTYSTDGFDEQCGRPPFVDVFDLDELTGASFLVTLCERHWTSRRMAAATARGCFWEDRESKPTLEVLA